MRIIDEKGRVFGKVNLIDLGIVVLIIAAIFAAGYKISRGKLVETKNATISYTICVPGVREQSARAINKEYKNIIDGDTKDELGEITDVRVEPGEKLVQRVDGEYELSTYPNKFDLYVTVKTEGTISNDGYYAASGKKIMYGDTVKIDNGYSVMTGMVEDIKTE